MTQEFSEAPASVTLKAIAADGWDIMLTIRDTDTGQLLPRLSKAIDWLKSNGYSPTAAPAQLHTQPAPMAAGPNPAQPMATTMAIPHANGGYPTAPICQIHHTAMKPSKHNNGWYCTQKNPDQTYCNQEIKL